MSNPSTNSRSGLAGYSRPRLATRADRANLPSSLKNSGWKVQATTTGNEEILLSNETTMELVWFDYDMISATDRRSAAATTARKIKGNTLADDLVLARERELGIVRSMGTTAAVPAAPTQQPLPMVVAPTIAAIAAAHLQLPSAVQQTVATTDSAARQTRSSTRANDALASLAGLSIAAAPAVASNPAPAPARAVNPANDRTGWVIQEIRGERGSKYFVQYKPGPNDVPRQPAQEWVHHSQVGYSEFQAWLMKKAGRLAQKNAAPPCVSRFALALRPAPVPATAGPSTAPVASASTEDDEMEDADMEDADGEEVPEWDRQWFNQ